MSPRSPRRLDARLGALALVALGLSACGARHNTLLVIADDVGIDAVSAYGVGESPAATPTLDSLAADGVLFTHAYANPVCSAARATILTGRYSRRTGVGAVVSHGLGTPLPLEEVTLPEVLEAEGVPTALIGKWHLGDARNGGDRGPNLAGFSHFAGHLWNIKPPESYFAWRRVVDGAAARSEVYATTANVDDALAWIRARSGPWVCVLAFNAAHAPLHAPPAELHGVDLEGRQRQQHSRLFLRAMVEALDRELGRLLDALGPGLRSRTNVVFVSDNGTASFAAAAPFSADRAKPTLYEGGVRVPLIVSGPAVKDPGREVDALVELVDLFPTVLELSGVGPEAAAAATGGRALDGRSLAPYLQSPGTQPLRRHAFVERFGSSTGRPQDGVALRDSRYKLIRFDDPSREELYDLELDPNEQVDLLRRERSAEEDARRMALVAELDRLHAELAPGRGARPPR